MHMKFQNCAVLEVMIGFTGEEFVVWLDSHVHMVASHHTFVQFAMLLQCVL